VIGFMSVVLCAWLWAPRVTRHCQIWLFAAAPMRLRKLPLDAKQRPVATVVRRNDSTRLRNAASRCFAAGGAGSGRKSVDAYFGNVS
jgi:hypothetical protein